MQDTELLELCKEVKKRFPDWDNKPNTPSSECLKVWMRGYSISEMGEGHDGYEATPPNERNKVNVYDWEIRDDPRHKITTGQEVFKWWYSEVKNIEYNVTPLYTSDYLLDKLLPITRVTFNPMSDGNVCVFFEPTMPIYDDIISDTPLKALLKLVIALDDAGELNPNKKGESDE